MTVIQCEGGPSHPPSSNSLQRVQTSATRYAGIVLDKDTAGQSSLEWTTGDRFGPTQPARSEIPMLPVSELNNLEEPRHEYPRTVAAGTQVLCLAVLFIVGLAAASGFFLFAIWGVMPPMGYGAVLGISIVCLIISGVPSIT